MNNTANLLEKIEKTYPKFSKGQKKIANYILKNYDISPSYIAFDKNEVISLDNLENEIESVSSFKLWNKK